MAQSFLVAKLKKSYPLCVCIVITERVKASSFQVGGFLHNYHWSDITSLQRYNCNFCWPEITQWNSKHFLKYVHFMRVFEFSPTCWPYESFIFNFSFPLSPEKNIWNLVNVHLFYFQWQSKRLSLPSCAYRVWCFITGTQKELCFL